MNTPSLTHRPPIFVIATAYTGLAGALLSVTLDSAQAIPEHLDGPAVVDSTVETTDRVVERPCFITPARWNESLDGHLPRCRTYVH